MPSVWLQEMKYFLQQSLGILTHCQNKLELMDAQETPFDDCLRRWKKAARKPSFLQHWEDGHEMIEKTIVEGQKARTLWELRLALHCRNHLTARADRVMLLNEIQLTGELARCKRFDSRISATTQVADVVIHHNRQQGPLFHPP